MGCDIRAILQENKDGQWEDREILEINRDYDLFSILAGVRGFYKPIAEPRGFPSGFEVSDSNYYKIKRVCFKENRIKDDEFWLGDHSFSWLTLQELVDYDWSHYFYFIPDHEEDTYDVYRMPPDFIRLFLTKRPLNKWRIVFGFDS